MRHERHNCALIQKKGALDGIFTERDVLRKVVSNPDTWKQKIDEVMTPNPATIAPDDSAEAALEKMEAGSFRNVPVVDADGAVHESARPEAVVLEECGPVRACVRVDGFYTGPEGERIVRYRTRYHFFVGLGLIKVSNEFKIVGATRGAHFQDIGFSLRLVEDASQRTIVVDGSG